MEIAHSEQRALERRRLTAPVMVLLHEGESDDTVGKLRDVSRQGAFLYTNSSINPGAELHLLMLIGPGSVAVPVFCAGHAVRVERGASIEYELGVAVQFSRFEILDNVVPRC